jgi:bifunctional UDP-N-acetylglucosamine pyrophosphorylase/glucosamine-1-phosphate N-acetyltransferase
MKNIQAIVLAAGKSTRFNTGSSKLIQKMCGQEMVLYSTKLFAQLNIPATLVVGYQKEDVMNAVTQHHGKTVTFVTQEEQLGTGHAVLCTKEQWVAEHLLIMNGDMPLVTQDIIEQLYAKHMATGAVMSFVVSHSSDPAGYSYGRVIENNGTIQIVEAKHFDGDPHEHCFVNAGIYILNRVFLEQAIQDIKRNEKSKEFYLTDLVKIASDQKKTVTTTLAPFDLIRGVNDLQELWAAEQIKRSELIRYWMHRGVRFIMPQAIHLDVNISIGAGTTIGGGVHLYGTSSIGKNCSIGAFSSLTNVTIGDATAIHPHCVISDATIGAHAQVGPFAHIYDHAMVNDHALIESFAHISATTATTSTREHQKKNTPEPAPSFVCAKPKDN